MVVVFILVAVALYWIPTYIAHRRNHHQFKSILVLNLLLGWTFIGWVIALVWSLSATAPVGSINPYAPPAAPVPIGWYQDPADPGQQRWWDGRQWTDQVQS